MTYNEISDEYIEWVSDGRNYRNAMKYLWSIIDKSKLTPHSTLIVSSSIYIISAVTSTYVEYSCSTGSSDRSYVAGIRLAATDIAGTFATRIMTSGITVTDSSTVTLPAGTLTRLYY